MSFVSMAQNVGFMIPMPVSYTHLDVYKRQIMKRTILRSSAVLGTGGFAGFLLAACSNNSSGSSEASKEINVYVDKGYKSYVEEAAKAFEKENGVKINIKTGDALGGL